MGIENLIEQLNSLFSTETSNRLEAGLLFVKIDEEQAYKPEFKSFNKFAESTKWHRSTVHSLRKICSIDLLVENFELLSFSKCDRIAKCSTLGDETIEELVNFATAADPDGKLPTYGEVKEACKNAKEGDEEEPTIEEESLKTLLGQQSKLLEEQKDLEFRLIEVRTELEEVAEKVTELSK